MRLCTLFPDPAIVLLSIVSMASFLWLPIYCVVIYILAALVHELTYCIIRPNTSNLIETTIREIQNKRITTQLAERDLSHEATTDDDNRWRTQRPPEWRTDRPRANTYFNTRCMS